MSIHRSRSQLAAYVVQSIEARGIAVAPTSRIDRMRRVFVRADGSPAFIPVGHRDFQIALEAERDLQLLGFIFDHSRGILPSRKLDERLKVVLEDAALPQRSAPGTPGRDAQCELFVAAVCAQANLKPVLGEPDVRCTCDGHAVGLAVKRIKSPRLFERRVKEAMKQVELQDLSGVVVADVSVMLNPRNERIVEPMGEGYFRALWRGAVQELVRWHDEFLFSRAANTRIRGLVLIDHRVRWRAADGWELNTLTFGVNLGSSSEGQRDFAELYSQFQRGLASSPIPLDVE